jgi:hypothetical protein
VIKFASALWPVGDFLRVLQFQPQINPTATIVESGGWIYLWLKPEYPEKITNKSERIYYA